jgi:hypothetical protein
VPRTAVATVRRAVVRRSHRGHRTCGGVARRRVPHRPFDEVGADEAHLEWLPRVSERRLTASGNPCEGRTKPPITGEQPGASRLRATWNGRTFRT